MNVIVPYLRFNATDQKFSSESQGEYSEQIRNRVNEARKIQSERFKDIKNVFCNAHMGSREIRKFCNIDDEGNQLLKKAITRFGLSARAYDRILKVARTISDLEGSSPIQSRFISEAIQYRSLDRDFTAMV
jgi:magnesium chelatase family protein